MEEKKTYNLILTCLSNIPGVAIKSLSDKDEKGQYKEENIAENEFTYYLVDGEKKIEISKGIMTNEAGVKYVMQKLDKKGDYLDSIYYVASEKVNREATYRDKDTGIVYHLGETHIQFFENQIYAYCDKQNFEPVNFIRPDTLISDAPNGEELINISTTIANKIIEVKNENSDKEFHLFIESNGGFRDFVNIATAVLSTLKNEDIHIDEVIGVNIVSTKQGVYVDKTDAYQIYDLYSGIDEFINYGRSKKIEEFFNESNIKLNKSMTRVLQAITDMSDNFVLCRPRKMFDSILKLKDSIESYNKQKDENKSNIFTFLVDKINREYKTIFNKCNDLQKERIVYSYPLIKEMILHCLNHNLIQQALTIYSEIMPNVLYEKKVVNPGKKVKKEYEEYNKSNQNSKYTAEYRFVQQDMMSYKKPNEGATPLYKFSYDNQNEKMFVKTPNEKARALERMLKGDYVATAYQIKDVKDVMKSYWEIKEARNYSNHADSSDRSIAIFGKIDSTKKYIEDTLSKLDIMFEGKQ